MALEFSFVRTKVARRAFLLSAPGTVVPMSVLSVSPDGTLVRLVGRLSPPPLQPPGDHLRQVARPSWSRTGAGAVILMARAVDSGPGAILWAADASGLSAVFSVELLERRP